MLHLGPHTFSSRLIVGTGKYPDFATMQACHEAAGADLVTVALRRVDLAAGPQINVLDFIDRTKIRLLPNTAGCYTADDAVETARIARELLGTDLIKPDTEGTLEAARILVKEGFTVLPYCPDDPVTCQRLEDIGCAAVMPLGAPIGSGLGIRNPYNLMIIRESVKVPLIVDAGVGTASDAAVAMELGADGLLVNTAIASAGDPPKMARAIRLAVEAGRAAFEAGRMPRRLHASASSPLEGLLGS
jgi:thiazole synthase